ncbi:hypothetical protein BDA99DRAFT_540931 [Phascolomyces articulosus]|uniref:Uncharacterized protein n=1 Tax=Phascolomyces articulosus TaxID=60185 RepID=A0AAD5JTE7_9FUNG|nr:hypothetical protein BDA99DRAFT_540931 [Phascolomyces articulosus]
MVKSALKTPNDLENFVYDIWNTDRSSIQMVYNIEKEIRRLYCLHLLGFQLICMNGTYHEAHEHSFWVERVAPLFFQVPWVMFQSGVFLVRRYEEDQQHSVDDSYKSIEEITSVEDGFAPQAECQHVVERRSVTILTTWDKRASMMKVLKLIICLYVSTLSSELYHISIEKQHADIPDKTLI